MFRDRRFLRCLRAIPEVHVIRLTVTRWPSLAFGIMSLIFHAFECGTNAPGIRGHEAPGIEWCSILAQWDGWVRMEPFLGFFHQSSKSLVVAARCGHIFATFCLGRLRVSRAAVGLSCLASHLAASRSRRSLLVLHAPRRSAVKPGTTPVELAAPRVRRARSSRRLDNQSNATPRSWCGSHRRARDGRAREPQPIRCWSR